MSIGLITHVSAMLGSIKSLAPVEDVTQVKPTIQLSRFVPLQFVGKMKCGWEIPVDAQMDST